MAYSISNDEGLELGVNQQRFPALQPTTYQPALDSDVKFCLNESSVDLLADDIKTEWKSKPKQCKFINKAPAETAYVIPDGLQWVFLGIPKIAMRNKADKRDIRPIQSGFTMKENNFESVTRLLLACIKDGQPILTNDGSIQVFTLSLNSGKTKLLEGYKQPPEYRSLLKLNKYLIKKFTLDSTKFWLHLASVPFVPRPEEFGNGKESSIASMYCIDGMPEPLAPEVREKLKQLASSPIITALIADPFALKAETKTLLGIGEAQAAENNDSELDSESNDNDIDF